MSDNTIEQRHERTSSEVQTVVDHLHNNRTTEREARTLRDAADRSLTDHAASKSLIR